MDIKDQTQELLNKALMGKLVKHDEVKALLRRIIGVCCKYQCGPCGRNVPISEVDPLTHIGKHGTKWPCKAEGIRRYFAWLLEESK